MANRKADQFFENSHQTQVVEAAGGNSGAGKDANAWVLQEHPEYNSMAPKWEYVDDHYTGKMLEPGRINRYLIQRSQAEHDKEYEERIANCSQPYHMAYIFDTFGGLISAADRNVTRLFQEDVEDGNQAPDGLGFADDPETPAGKLMANTDGEGTNYEPFWQQFVTDLIRFNRMFVLVEGVEWDADGEVLTEPHYRLIDPLSVTNWRYEGSRMVECMVKHQVDTRENLRDEAKPRDRYTHYHEMGWDVYEVTVTKGGKKRVTQLVEESGIYDYFDSADGAQRMLPIFRVDLPFRRYLAYQAARRQNSIFNQESERDASLRQGLIARLAIVGTTTFYQEVEKNLGLGFKLMRHDPDNSTTHYFIVPPVEHARLATEVLDAKVKDFMVTTFREYADAGSQKTATEVDQDRRAGLEAFLELVITALTEAENQSVKRFEQAVFPKRRDLWGQAIISRDPDFQYISVASMVDKLVERIFGPRTLPVGTVATRATLKMWLDYQGVKYDDAEVEQAVDRFMAQLAQEEDAMGALTGGF